VTGQTKTTAIQIDLSTGKILQNVGADISTFQGFKKDQEKRDKSEKYTPHNSEREPFWLIMKNYDYLSYDHEKGIT
jgi:hypothetical protein